MISWIFVGEEKVGRPVYPEPVVNLIALFTYEKLLRWDVSVLQQIDPSHLKDRLKAAEYPLQKEYTADHKKIRIW